MTFPVPPGIWSAATTAPPAYAGPRAGLYLPAYNVYNWKPSNTRIQRAALAKAMAGQYQCEVAIGDSLTASYTGAAYDRLNAWPRVYASTLAALGVTSAGTGLVRIQDQAFTNTAVVLAGTWNTTLNTVPFCTAANSTATWTFTPTQNLTAVALYYARSGATGAFTVSVNGAASGAGFASVGAGGATARTSVQLTGLNLPAGTPVTVVFTATSATTTIPFAFEGYNAAGVAVHNVAQSGSTAAGSSTYQSWTSTADPALSLINVYGPSTYMVTPSTVHLAPGTNDINAGTSAAATTAAIATIRGNFPASDCRLYLPPQPGELTPAQWAPFQYAMYDLADALDAPLFDLQARMGGYATESANGLTGDTIAHLNRAGYADWGRSPALVAAS